MGQPLSGPLLVPVAEEKNYLEKLGQAIKCSGPEDTCLTSVHSSLARSGDIASQGGQEVQCYRVPRRRRDRILGESIMITIALIYYY